MKEKPLFYFSPYFGFSIHPWPDWICQLLQFFLKALCRRKETKTQNMPMTHLKYLGLSFPTWKFSLFIFKRGGGAEEERESSVGSNPGLRWWPELKAGVRHLVDWAPPASQKSVHLNKWSLRPFPGLKLGIHINVFITYTRACYLPDTIWGTGTQQCPRGEISSSLTPAR